MKNIRVINYYLRIIIHIKRHIIIHIILCRKKIMAGSGYKHTDAKRLYTTDDCF